MAAFHLVGFESGSASGEGVTVGAASGTGSFVTSPVRSGTYAGRTQADATSSSVYFELWNPTGTVGSTRYDKATVYHRFYFRYATKAASGAETIFASLSTGGSVKLRLRLNSAGRILVYDSADNGLATGTAVLSADTWYRIEVLVGTGASASWEVRINGTTDTSGTGNLLTANNGGSVYGKYVNTSGQAVDYFYDDILLDDANWPGAGQITRLRADANGTFTGWTGDFNDVDDVPPHDDDGTFISTSTNTTAETVNMQSAATGGISGTINGVRAAIVARRTSGATIVATYRVISGATTDDVQTSLTSGYNGQGQVLAVDPNTSAAWTTSGIDGVQVGIVHAQSQTREARCTAIYLMVDYTPAGGPPDILLEGSLSASASASANLQRGDLLSSSITAQASAAASLTTDIRCASAVSASASVAAAITTTQPISAALSAQASISASLTTEIALASVVSGNATATATGLASVGILDGLISFWELDETSGQRNDSHGTNHLTDNNTVGSTTGNVGTAADFEASNSEYLSCASNASLQTGDISFTFSAWVYLESTGNYVILAKDSSSDGREYTLDTWSGEYRFYIAGTYVASTTGGMANTTGAWRLITAWRDQSVSSDVCIQVDDGTIFTAGVPNGIATQNAAFTIGARVYSGFEGYFDGLIDQVGFWKRKLTPTERTWLYNSGAGRAYEELGGAIYLAGSVAAMASSAANLTTEILVAASSTGLAAVAGSVTTELRLAASVTAQGSATADLTSGSSIELQSAVSAAATTTADLSTQIRLASSVTATASSTANLTTEISCASAVSGTASSAGDITTDVRCASAVSASTSVAAAITTEIRCAAALSAQASASAALQSGELFDGALTAQAATAAALTTVIQAQAAIAGSATASAGLTTDVYLSTSVTCNGTAAASLTTETRLASAVSGTASADADIATDVRCASAVTATATSTAEITTEVRLVASLSAQASVAGVLTVGDLFEAAAAGSATAQGDLSTQIHVAAAITGSANISGALTTSIELASAISGTATGTAGLTVGDLFLGAAVGTANVQAALTTEVLLAGDVTATAATSADLTSEALFSGSVTASVATAAALLTEVRMATMATAEATVDADLFISKELAAVIQAAAGVDAALETQSLSIGPTEDITTGGWLPSTGTDLYAVLDEDDADDNDYIYATGTGQDTCELGFGGLALASPTSTVRIVIRHRTGS